MLPGPMPPPLFLHVIHNGNRRLDTPPPLGVYVTNGRSQMGNKFKGIPREMTNELNSN